MQNEDLLKRTRKMEVICFEITIDTLRYTQGLGALTIWGIISCAIFKWNSGRYFSFNKQDIFIKPEK
jgi:hypothetical protein